MQKLVAALFTMLILAGCTKTYIGADGNRYKETKDGMVKIESGD